MLHSFFLPYITTNRDQFIKELQALADYLMTDINKLAAVMHHESHLSPTAINSSSNATGLIQFMPSTARSLGTTVEQLMLMSNVEQLVYVKKYFSPFRGKLSQYRDVYFSVFYPAANGKPSTWAFPRAVYAQNSGIDLNGDQLLTVGDFDQWILRGFPTDLQNLLKKKRCKQRC